jgi:4-hydroxybenzoate polyprenyltransferase
LAAWFTLQPLLGVAFFMGLFLAAKLRVGAAWALLISNCILIILQFVAIKDYQSIKYDFNADKFHSCDPASIHRSMKP